MIRAPSAGVKRLWAGLRHKGCHPIVDEFFKVLIHLIIILIKHILLTGNFIFHSPVTWEV